MPEQDTLVALSQVLTDAGGIVTLLWLLIREQARYESLVKWVLEHYPPSPQEDA